MSDRPTDIRGAAVKATVAEGPSRDRQSNCPKDRPRDRPLPLEGPPKRRRFEWPSKGSVETAPFRGAVSNGRRDGVVSRHRFSRSRLKISSGRRNEAVKTGPSKRRRFELPSRVAVETVPFQMTVERSISRHRRDGAVVEVPFRVAIS
jgi:hypothetical protein